MGTIFLGVERSATGRRWRVGLDDDTRALGYAQRLGVPEIVARVLLARGVDEAMAAGFLAPRLREQLPDPGHLKDMDKAAERLAAAIRGDELVAVFGDYDVDGATASALLHRFIAAAGGRVRVYIPDRQKEGYGPNAPALLKLKEEGAALVVTVDCGVTAHAPLAEAAAAGVQVIVVDHHVAEPKLPQALAVVNPNRLDETSPHGQLAAVGVAFLLAVQVNRLLRESGWYEDRPAPELLELLDLVALGTVCDVVPLTGINRALVAQGLKVMAARANPGLAALADIARLSEPPGAYHAGFVLGPRINAGGRVGACDLGARLLTTGDAGEAAALARRLDELNAERRALEQAALAAAIEQIEEAGQPRGALIMATGEGWHPGVIGVVASRLRERYDRPACVVALEGGIGKGSGRSVAGVDLGSAVIAARQAGLLINGGGHAMAAGFTVEARQVMELRRFLEERLDGGAGGPAVPRLEIDGVLSARGATVELAGLLEKCGPFGSGNPEPRFALTDLRVVRSDVVGDGHVRAVLAGGDGARLKAIAFRSAGNGVGRALLAGAGAPLHLAGHLRTNNWQGRSELQLVIDDAAPAAG
jgi:single-stranded-DNA-specific exonuclease